MLATTRNWQDRDQILAIAKQCPKKGGAAVYWARAWYAALTGVSVQEEDCVILRSKEGGENEQPTDVEEFKLFPNPATTAISLIGPTVPEGENWTIGIYSVTGQLMGSHVYSQTGQTELSLQNLPSGTFWCKVSNGKKQLSVQRISVIK